MIDKVSVQECAICGACINACPVDAISLDKVHLDFRYPQINEDICIHCNQCEKACPILGNKGKPDEGYPVACAAKSENDPMRLRSSSGGIFYELADRMLRDGGYVCGAVFDDKFHVKHILSNAKEDILRMMGSKYAQSDVGHCYREIKDVLEKGCKVLFSGCPCQVAGLRTFLGKEYPNLVLVELICHGIPSDHMLQTYIGMQERKYGARLTRMEFRNKKKGWHNSSVRMEFENGKTAFMDFEGEQYFSQIRTRRWNIRGVRGEINDNTVRFLNASNQPVEQPMQRIDVGINNNSEWSHKGIMFLDKQVYQNPYYPARMNDDEIAVASCLSHMKTYVESGTEFYSLREALQDTYLSFMLEQAIETGETVKTETQSWSI